MISLRYAVLWLAVLASCGLAQAEEQNPSVMWELSWRLATSKFPLRDGASNIAQLKALQSKAANRKPAIDGTDSINASNRSLAIQEFKGLIAEAKKDKEYWERQQAKPKPKVTPKTPEQLSIEDDAVKTLELQRALARLQGRVVPNVQRSPKDQSDTARSTVRDPYWLIDIDSTDFDRRLSQAEYVLSALEACFSNYGRADIGPDLSGEGSRRLKLPNEREQPALPTVQKDELFDNLIDPDGTWGEEDGFRFPIDKQFVSDPTVLDSLVGGGTSTDQLRKQISQLRKELSESESLVRPSISPLDTEAQRNISDVRDANALLHEWLRERQSDPRDVSVLTNQERNDAAYRIDQELRHLEEMRENDGIDPDRYEIYRERLTKQRQAIGDVGSEGVVAANYWSNIVRKDIEAIWPGINPTRIGNDAVAIVTGYDAIENRQLSKAEQKQREADFILNVASEAIPGGKGAAKAFEPKEFLADVRITIGVVDDDAAKVAKRYPTYVEGGVNGTKSKDVIRVRNDASKLPSGTQVTKSLPWDSWKNLPKATSNGREYAQIGDRLYSRHAVDRMQPSGLGRPIGADAPGRSIAPAFVDDVIRNGTKSKVVVGGVSRTIHTSGTVQVVTEQGGRIVITVNPFSGN